MTVCLPLFCISPSVFYFALLPVYFISPPLLPAFRHILSYLKHIMLFLLERMNLLLLFVLKFRSLTHYFLHCHVGLCYGFLSHSVSHS